MSQPLVFNPKTIRLIIGLGNPGSKYARTRHNAGFIVIDELASRLNLSWHKADLLESAQGRIHEGEATVYLVKPQTFMNSSGQVLPSYLKKGIKPEEILVIHDELEKPFGNVSTRFGGSAKGHNGLRSIIERIGMNFWRLRFGIGRPQDREEVPVYVLMPFSQEEEVKIDRVIAQAINFLVP